MATSRPPFPEDLYEIILLRLPVMSLLRFKCVCKNWYALIKNPNFVKQHLNNCSNNKFPQLVIYDFGGSPPVTVISDHNSVPLHDNLNYLERFTGMTHLVGSVDGLFLLYRVSDDDAISLLALWNPATREVRVLPEPEIPLSTFDAFFGFGLDPSTNDYKMVYFDKQYAAVYSCSKDSWRIFTHKVFKINEVYEHYFLSLEAFSYGSAYLNGAYYWAIRERGSECNFLSFDFSNEVFGEIDGPGDNNSHRMPILFDDSLALFNLLSDAVTDVWVMIQPGVWNKLFTFQCFPYFKSWYSSTVIVATRNCRLVSYNVKTQKTTRLGFHHPRLKRNTYEDNCEVYTYKESLVTIKREN